MLSTAIRVCNYQCALYHSYLCIIMTQESNLLAVRRKSDAGLYTFQQFFRSASQHWHLIEHTTSVLLPADFFPQQVVDTVAVVRKSQSSVQTVGGRKMHVAYCKDHQLIISTATATEGVNFIAAAKTSEDVADLLLMAITLAQQKAK